MGTDTTTDSATVVWEPPMNDNGSEVIGYVVEKKNFDKNDTGEWFRVNEEPITKCTTVVTDLEEDQVYEVQVRAVNKAGVGEACECCDFVKAIERPEEPEFNVDPDFKSHVAVHAGQRLELDVSFHGKPTCEAEWLRVGAADINQDAIITSDESTTKLLVEHAKREDRGKYTVTIMNKLGMKKITYSVKVFDTPGPVGDIICKDVKSTSAWLNWTAPEYDGCSQVNEYLIEKREAASNRYSRVSGECTRPFYKVTGLEEGKSYVFRVTAINEFGAGVSRETSKSIKATQTPSSPMRLEVDEVTKTSIQISWKKPEHDGGCKITSYIVEVSPSELNEWAVRAQVKDTVFTSNITKLLEDSYYDLRVIAINDLGHGEPSSPLLGVKTYDDTEAPRVDMRGLKRILLKSGAALDVTVAVQGKPKPEVKWQASGRDLSDDEDVRITTSNKQSTLHKTRVSRKDTGTYRLNAVNAKGTASGDVQVDVLGMSRM